MLARQLPGVSVLVSPDRYLAGCVAEHHFARHRPRARRRLSAPAARARRRHRHRRPRRHRAPGDAAARPSPRAARHVDRRRRDRDGRTSEVEVDGLEPHVAVFGARRVLGMTGRRDARAPGCWPWRASRRRSGSSTICARPDTRSRGRSRFAITIRTRGATCSGSSRRRQAAGADAVLTTEKDFVRLLPHRPFSMPAGWVPLTMEPDPLPEFRRWLAGSVAAARDIIVG